MLTERDLISHDDYENFAKYLGVDYDDFCDLMIPESDVDDSDLVGISNHHGGQFDKLAHTPLRT